ncbi:hypothetical protein [Xanthomonas campestris]|uniref:hypothetical protein n=1 Tax=Xanthomonas campestris TaxID=339 RepID=UPI0023685C76|nr:hypothetical protein [Xanthomonas campestris]WDJ85478.1 hypothetical protein JH279_02085 [Xanthomonas campestris pv. incanae]
MRLFFVTRSMAHAGGVAVALKSKCLHAGVVVACMDLACDIIEEHKAAMVHLVGDKRRCQPDRRQPG